MNACLKKIFGISLVGFISLFITQHAHAASLANISDTISTSIPSAANVLKANNVNTDTQATIYDLGQATNTTMYLASDSAKFINDGASETLDIGQIVASMSAQASSLRTLYFTAAIPHAHHKGDAVIVPITAMHKMQFTVQTSIPSGGNIVLTFPALSTGDANNAASPSASTFQLNNIATAQIKLFSGASAVTYTLVATNPTNGTSPTLALNSLSAGITTGTVVTLYIGCTTATSASCSVNNPLLINPTKSYAGTTGNADIWKVAVTTQDASSNTLDTGSAKIGTVESVQVQGTVEPTLTFTISGFASGTNTNTVGTCGLSYLTNSGIPTTATSVNLGLLTNAQINTAVQGLAIATNGSSGYAITATSSGQFKNAATGQIIQDANGGNGLTANDTPVPAVMTAGTPSFGIHACGTRANLNTDQWVVAGTIPTAAGSSTAKFSNPWQTGSTNFYNTIASYTGGPVNSETTAVIYGSTVNATTPPGIYTTVFTYVATATF